MDSPKRNECNFLRSFLSGTLFRLVDFRIQPHLSQILPFPIFGLIIRSLNNTLYSLYLGDQKTSEVRT